MTTLTMQPTFPPPKLVEDVVPFTAAEALLSMLEEQSSTLMIEGVLSNLCIRGGDFEHGVKEEEGWSSTLGKDDDEDQADDALEKQTKPEIMVRNEE